MSNPENEQQTDELSRKGDSDDQALRAILDRDFRQTWSPAAAGEGSPSPTEPHVHDFATFSRTIEACCDSMHYWCECGEHDPCHVAPPEPTGRQETGGERLIAVLADPAGSLHPRPLRAGPSLGAAAMTADAGNVRSDGDARVARYAEAIQSAYNLDTEVTVQEWDDRVARAVVAVADGELAELRAEVERLRRHLPSDAFLDLIEKSSLGSDDVRAASQNVSRDAAAALVRWANEMEAREAAEAERDALVAAMGALADEWMAEAREHSERGRRYFDEGKTAESIAEAATANAFEHLVARLRALVAANPRDERSESASPSTAGSDAPCRCGHAKAEHPAPDGDTYCRRCSCAHYLPTVADMMRDEAAVGRLLAAVDGSAGSDGERAVEAMTPVPQAAVDAALAHDSDGFSSRGQWVGCICGERLPCRIEDGYPDADEEHRVRSEHVAAAVVAAVAGPLKAEGKAEGLREAADNAATEPHITLTRGSVARWLRERADRIEALDGSKGGTQ